MSILPVPARRSGANQLKGVHHVNRMKITRACCSRRRIAAAIESRLVCKHLSCCRTTFKRQAGTFTSPFRIADARKNIGRNETSEGILKVSVLGSSLHGARKPNGATDAQDSSDEITLGMNSMSQSTTQAADESTSTSTLFDVAGFSELSTRAYNTSSVRGGDTSHSSSSRSLSSLIIADGGSAEIDGASAQPVTFTGTAGILKLDDSLAYTGKITGLTGTDGVDLTDVQYGPNTKVTFQGDATGGILTVTDRTHTANIAISGNYLTSEWNLSSDGSGGTVVVDPVPTDTWKPIDIGAGGYLTGIDIAPDGTMVVRTDTYGAYIWNGTQWQQLVTSTSMPASFTAPGSGLGVYEIQIAPSDSNVLYMMYDGYVFRSSNKGATWTQTSFSPVTENPNDPYRIDGQKMAVDPNNPNVVYVGTPQKGLFVTTNGGVTWQKVTAVPGSQTDSNGIYPGITGIQFVKGSGVTGGKTNTIFASSYGNGVYESTDGGATWIKTSGGPSDVEHAVVSNTGAYYAVGNDGTSLWRYANGSWTELLSNAVKGGVGGNGIQAVAIDPFNASHIVVATPSGILDQSFDGGATWQGLDWNMSLQASDVPWLSSVGNYMSIGDISFDPKVPGKLWASDGIGVWNTILPQNFRTTPITWNSQSVGIEQLVANEIIVPEGGKPVLASWDRPFFYVNDPSSYPTSVGTPGQSKFAAGWSIDYASSNPSFVVGIADWWNNEESGYSTDGGKTWQTFPNELPQKTIGGSIAASTPTNIIWAPADGVAPYYTLDGGVTWKQVVLPGVTDWSNFDFAYYLDRRTVTADRVLPNTFYMYYVGSTNSGVYRSTDGGVTWTEVFAGQISPISGFNAKIEAVPGEAGNLFFTGGRQSGPSNEQFFQSSDGGSTWKAVANVTNVTCFGFGASPTAGGYPSIYIVGSVNNVSGIWQSNNDGQSWTEIGQEPDSSLSQIKTISGDPNTYGQVYVGFGGDGYAYLPAMAGVTAVVPSITNGAAGIGKTITLTLQLSAPLTVSGGVPTLTLNDGGVATYTGGSGTDALTFTYMVAAGQNTPNLAVTAVNLNSATVTDTSGNAGSLDGAVSTPAWTLDIDTLRPTVTGSADTPASAILDAGKTVTWNVTLTEAVTVSGGIPTLTLNDGGTAVYAGGSGTNVLTFVYTVAAGQNTPNLTVVGFSLNSATVADTAGNSADLSGVVTGVANKGSILQIDTVAPTVSSVTAPTGDFSAGKVITFTVHLTEAVTVTSGRPQLLLNDGGVATYVSGSGTNALSFNYTVLQGQNIPDLAVVGVNAGSAVLRDVAGNIADLSGAVVNPIGTLQIDTTRPTVTSVTDNPVNGDLNIGKSITLTLHFTEAVTVVGGVPTLKLNDGGTATYSGGSGTNALTFSYKVGPGQNTTNLGVLGVNLNSASIVDAAGNSASLTGAATNPTGVLEIDTVAPKVSWVEYGVETQGTKKSVVVTIHLTEAANILGGTPAVTLNNGETATYTGGSGTNALTFSYVLPAGQSTSNLAVAAFHANSATIKDAAGNAANLSALTDATVTTGGTLELATAYSGKVSFAGSTGTLKIDSPSTFNGNIAGQLTTGDYIDLPTVTAGAKAAVHYSGNNSPGTLTVSDGTHTATIALSGSYSLGNFTVSSDGHGGTLVVDPPLSSSQAAAPTNDPINAIGVLNQQMALWAQHVASVFPSSGGFVDGVSIVHGAGLNGDHSYTSQLGAGRH